jgi:hypothetical protein
LRLPAAGRPDHRRRGLLFRGQEFAATSRHGHRSTPVSPGASSSSAAHRRQREVPHPRAAERLRPEPPGDRSREHRDPRPAPRQLDAPHPHSNRRHPHRSARAVPTTRSETSSPSGAFASAAGRSARSRTTAATASGCTATGSSSPTPPSTSSPTATTSPSATVRTAPSHTNPEPTCSSRSCPAKRPALLDHREEADCLPGTQALEQGQVTPGRHHLDVAAAGCPRALLLRARGIAVSSGASMPGGSLGRRGARTRGAAPRARRESRASGRARGRRRWSVREQRSRPG